MFLAITILITFFKEILIQQTQNNNYVNNEPSPSSSPSNSDTHYRKGLNSLAPLIRYKIKDI